MTDINCQRGVLKELIKRVEKRIKEVQQESKEAYTQEDVWIKEGVINELIRWKISLEKWRKKLKYEIDEEL